MSLSDMSEKIWEINKMESYKNIKYNYSKSAWIFPHTGINLNTQA